MPLRSPEAHRADLAACRELLRTGSRTFHAASKLLPEAVRDPATALYAFCRLADDAVDHGTQPLAALAELRERLERVYRGEPWPYPADRAFADVVAQHGIPYAMPSALLEGFEWDARGRRYETLSELHEYATRVAGTVGTMMALLMGAREPELLARACDLGVAMQLTNIARDVGEDARAGRLYLPLAWLREAGIEPDSWLAAPAYDARLGAVMKRLLVHADALYARSGEGIAKLPLGCRPAMHAARLMYAEIGREVERRGLDSVSQRAVVAGTRKAALLASALATTAGTAVRDPRSSGAPPLEEARFLVDAVALAARAPATADGSGWRRVEDRVVWVIDLFERLERRERELQAAVRGPTPTT
jgi:phytoene synthase